ncbi:hypothetical protein IMG5_200610 [Ichthyophthirius multifiliis]|uniref:Uncharacterized protein n=1 Tax=Ichthyophthirius multifiliis TaxID=5932 RepID=G0R5S7_ICHMU|nr:hypothetical protein IMG5_200610 [Ichthyophthirius multifiliis]EGR27185.1 hypothetical protein IMG5_200610 [Ichthyophthirius multifiliis]|eukprot:XP_004024069.1 hypothetical protein IMG5_200610 [Ichthyophthirius multifiliis]
MSFRFANFFDFLCFFFLPNHNFITRKSKSTQKKAWIIIFRANNITYLSPSIDNLQIFPTKRIPKSQSAIKLSSASNKMAMFQTTPTQPFNTCFMLTQFVNRPLLIKFIPNKNLIIISPGKQIIRIETPGQTTYFPLMTSAFERLTNRLFLSHVQIINTSLFSCCCQYECILPGQYANSFSLFLQCRYRLELVQVPKLNNSFTV